MGYSPKRKRERTLEEIAGVELVELSGGRKVQVRVHTLGTLWKFQERLARAVANPNNAAGVVVFFQYSLISPDEGLLIRVRRVIGLPDFTARMIRKEIGAGDVKKLMNLIVEANLGMTFDDYVAKCIEKIKKKMELHAKEEQTGEKWRHCCSGTGVCDQQSCSE